MRLIVQIVLALICLSFSSCKSAPVKNSSKLGVPSIVDGEVDELWEIHLTGLSECNSEDVCELYRRAAEDAYFGTAFSKARAENATITEILGVSLEVFNEQVETVRYRNAEWLKERVNNTGWFDVESSGTFPDEMAFLIVQHSDHDPIFQQHILEILQQLHKEGNTSPKNIAYLADRLAVGRDEPQIYGTQGACVEAGVWRPRPIDEPNSVNLRRREKALEPIENYIAEIGSGCG